MEVGLKIGNWVWPCSLRYLAEFGRFWGLLHKGGWRYKDTFCEWNV